MKINKKEELDLLLSDCRAIPYQDVKVGGTFYKIKSQSFTFPDGTVQNQNI